ncbi:MAG: phasin family protein [Actinomycetota bacterium]
MAKQPADQIFDFDVTKYLAEFKVPGLDVDSFVSSQRRNIEALTKANRLAYDGLQAVMKRQTEILRQTMDEVAQAGKEMSEPGTAHDKAARQAELAKDAFERALSNMREMSEMVAKANSEAFDLLNNRFSQVMDEMREALLKSGGPKK